MIGRRSLLLAGVALPVAARAQCVIDTPAVDACLGGVRITGPVPSLDLSFLASPLDPRITFTRASVGTYFDVAGTMQTAATNAPRFDYDPVTHAPRGLLIEEQRINVQLNSGRIDNASWNQALNTVTATATAAPDGTTNGAKVTPTAASGLHSTSGGSAITAGSVNTFSIYAKAAGYPRVRVQFNNGAQSNGFFATFDLTNGTVGAITYFGSGSGGSVQISAAGNGWYRCVISGTLDGTSNASTAIVYVDNGTTTTFVGDGTSGSYLWGGQIEAGAFATSYIPTTAATATRAIDSAIMSTSPWFTNPLALSYVVDALQPATGTANYLQFDDTTNNNRTSLSSDVGLFNLRYFENNGGAATVNSIAAGSFASGVPFKGGVSSTSGAHIYSLNGGAAVSNNSAASPPVVTTLRIGKTVAATAGSFYVRRFRYWSRALSATELQQVTT